MEKLIHYQSFGSHVKCKQFDEDYMSILNEMSVFECVKPTLRNFG